MQTSTEEETTVIVRIGIDNCICHDAIENLHSSGVRVVKKAYDEMDQDWVEEALSLGAQVIVSPDIDVQHYCLEGRIPFIKFWRTGKWSKQVKHLKKALRKFGYDIVFWE